MRVIPNNVPNPYNIISAKILEVIKVKLMKIVKTILQLEEDLT